MYHDFTYAMQTEIMICRNHLRVGSGEVKILTGATSGGDDNVRAVIRRSYIWWEYCSHLHNLPEIIERQKGL